MLLSEMYRFTGDFEYALAYIEKPPNCDFKDKILKGMENQNREYSLYSNPNLNGGNLIFNFEFIFQKGTYKSLPLA